MFKNDVSTISNTLPHFTSQGIMEVETQTLYLLSASGVFCVDELPMFSLCGGWGKGRIVFVFLTFLTYVKLSALGLCATGATQADPGLAAVMSKLRVLLGREWIWNVY